MLRPEMAEISFRKKTKTSELSQSFTDVIIPIHAFSL